MLGIQKEKKFTNEKIEFMKFDESYNENIRKNQILRNLHRIDCQVLYYYKQYA